MITVIPTSTAEHLAKRLEKFQDINVIYPDTNKDGKRYFPDGEIYARISTQHALQGRVIILHAGAPNPSRGLIELEMLIEIVKRSAAGTPELFFTYLPYSMQDKEFHEGETNAAENILRKFTEYFGIEKMYALDLHCAGRLWVTKYPIVNVSASELLKTASRKDYSDAVFATPDSGHERRIGIKGTRKKRLHSYDSQMVSDDEFKKLVDGQNVGVIDDNLETGGTLMRFYDECKKSGGKAVFALITHGLLDEGVKKISKKFATLYLSNAVDRIEANVDITPLIFDTLNK